VAENFGGSALIKKEFKKQEAGQLLKKIVQRLIGEGKQVAFKEACLMVKKMDRLAVLIYVVHEGEKRLSSVGHTLIQKFFYLLHEAKNFPLGYKFRLYYYGPYCAELWGDLNTLAELGYLNIQAKSNGFGYEINVTVDGKELINSHHDFLANARDKIEDLLTILEGEPVRRLEDLATAFYVFNDWKKKGIQSGDGEVIASLQNLKPHLKEEEIKAALQVLRGRLPFVRFYIPAHRPGG